MQLRCCCLGVVLALAAPAAAQQRPWRVAFDGLVYTDTDNVQAYTPSLSVRRALDADGSRVGASAAVDVVSAASVDVVSHATPRFLEARTQGQLDGVAALGDQQLSLAYRFSWEPDYLSNGLTAGWRSRLGTPDSVLDVTYGLTWDVVGRSGSSWSVFSEELFTHSAALSLTQNLGPETILRVVYGLTAQHGYMEKPYRYVPLFPASVDEASITSAQFDRQRSPQRPPESVPDTRVGHALGGRLVQYLEPIDGSLRLDYQIYLDDWSVMSHLVDVRVLGTVSRGLRFGGYARGYFQTGASFWQRTYRAEPGEIPLWRSLDRDLSTYGSVTGGLRVEWEWQDLSGYVDGAAMVTHWEDFLLLSDRLAILGQVGLRWTPS